MVIGNVAIMQPPMFKLFIKCIMLITPKKDTFFIISVHKVSLERNSD